MIGYLSHALGGDGDPVSRQDNIANAIDWIRFLVDHTAWAIQVPWLAFVIALRELHRPRAFADQLRIMTTCDAIILVGGRISPHMKHEARVALRAGIAVIDLTDLGWHAPTDMDGGRARELLYARADAALAKVGRHA